MGLPLKVPPPLLQIALVEPAIVPEGLFWR